MADSVDRSRADDVAQTDESVQNPASPTIEVCTALRYCFRLECK